MRLPPAVEYTPTPPFPSPATKTAGTVLGMPPAVGAHLGKPPGRDTWCEALVLAETSSASAVSATTRNAIPITHRRCLRLRASGNRACASPCEGLVFGASVVVMVRSTRVASQN